MKISTWRCAVRLAAVSGTVFMALNVSAVPPESPRNGQIHQTAAMTRVWDENAKVWVTPEVFWLSYTDQSDGKFWGRATDYPPYRDVSEHDTILIEVDEGSCLMYFFHKRWRRAQDVRRWDPAFNDVSGCPYVFD